MTLFYPLKQTTLHIPGTGPAHDSGRGHLFIVLTSPDAQEEVLCVSISSVYVKCDETCVLSKGDHDFIKHDSFVFYALTKKYTVKHLRDRVNDGDVTYKGLISEEIYETICDGLLDSRLSPPWAMAYFNENASN
ncbi:hypothetical protein MnTg02_02467 [bacterium MnTg02]|nr:hypothetical protein MnTg02_02467 [bacterium MnTg02]